MQIINRTILITGGTSGIGKALVEHLAPTNERILVVAKNPQRLEALREEYNNVDTYVCDLAAQDSVKTVFDTVLKFHPELSVVINNAAVQFEPMLHEADFNFDGIAEEIAVNLRAPVWTCALTVKHLLQCGQDAAFVNITSGLAHSPKKTSAVYCATKAGLSSFTASLRYQLEHTNVRVHSAVLPLVDTPMTRGRGRSKLAAVTVAQELVQGLERNQEDIYVGKAKWLPILSRISPRLMKRILKNG